jgi:hypothetical protein
MVVVCKQTLAEKQPIVRATGNHDCSFMDVQKE